MELMNTSFHLVNNYNEIGDNGNTTMSSSDTMTDDLTKWIAIVLFVGIIVFNGFVIIILVRSKKNGRMTVFVKHLAIADLLGGLLYVLPEIIGLLLPTCILVIVFAIPYMMHATFSNNPHNKCGYDFEKYMYKVKMN